MSQLSLHMQVFKLNFIVFFSCYIHAIFCIPYSVLGLYIAPLALYSPPSPIQLAPLNLPLLSHHAYSPLHFDFVTISHFWTIQLQLLVFAHIIYSYSYITPCMILSELYTLMNPSCKCNMLHATLLAACMCIAIYTAIQLYVIFLHTCMHHACMTITIFSLQSYSYNSHGITCVPKTFQFYFIVYYLDYILLTLQLNIAIHLCFHPSINQPMLLKFSDSQIFHMQQLQLQILKHFQIIACTLLSSTAWSHDTCMHGFAGKKNLL